MPGVYPRSGGDGSARWQVSGTLKARFRIGDPAGVDAARRGTLHLTRFLRAAQLVGAAGLTLFALSRSLVLSHLLIVMVGFGMIVVGACCNTLLQTIVEDDKRGRVMSLYAAAFIGVGPIGALVAGQVAEAFGVQRAFLLNGLLCLALAIALHAKRTSLEAMLKPHLQARA